MRIVFDTDYINLNYVEFSDLITATNNSHLNSGIQIFPNPFGSGGTNITAKGAFIYTVSDILGHQIAQGQGEDFLEVGENFPQGTYLLRVITKDNSVDLKIIKNY